MVSDFERGRRLLALQIADRLAQRDLAQLAAHGRGTVGGFCRALVEGQRLGEAPETFHHAPLEHHQVGLALLRGAERLELREQAGGSAEVAHFHRGTRGFLEREALHLERQGCGRGVERAEALARFDPFSFPRLRERAPQRDVVAFRGGAAREILQCVGAAPQHDVGDRTQYRGGAVLRGALVQGGDVEHAFRFGRQVAREIEARQLELRRHAAHVFGGGGGGDQVHLAVAEVGLAVEAPGLRVEREQAADRAARAFSRNRRRCPRAGVGQNQAAGARDDDLVGSEFDREIVGERLQRDAVGRGQRIELDVFLRFEKSARRPERGHHQQRIADLGVGEAMQLTRLVERDGDARAAAGQHLAHRAERLGRLEHHVSDDHRPGVAVEPRAGKFRPVELELNHLPAARGHDCGAADAACRRRDLGDVDGNRAVEHQPDRVGTAEHRGRRGLREWKRDVQRLAMAADLCHDGSRSVRRACGFHLFGLARRNGLGRAWCFGRAGWLRRCASREGGCLGRGLDRLDGRRGFGSLRLRLRQSRGRLLARRLRCRRRAAAFPGPGSQRGDLRRRVGALGARTDRLHVDDVVVVLAERADVDLADKFELHRRGIAARLRVDRRNRRRQRGLHVGEVETQRRLERHRHLVVVALDRNRDQRRQPEGVARKGRLHADAHAHRRQHALVRDLLLRARLLLGFARAARQFLDDLLRQPGRQPVPALGQQVDEQLFPRRHRVDEDLASEREAHRHSVGVGARGIHVACGLHRNAVDGHVHRPLERDDDDAVREPHVRLGLLGEREDEPHIAVLTGDREFALHRRGLRARGKQQEQRGQRQLQHHEDRNDPQTETRRDLRLLMRTAQRLDGDRPSHCPSARAPSPGHDASAPPP